MKIGDEVKWTSQAGGFSKEKVGKIVALVPAGDSALDHVPEGLRSDNISTTLGRKEDSYLVQLGDSKEVYWPLVGKLKVVGHILPPNPETGDEEGSVNDKQLPGVPPPGALHNAVKKFVTQRLKIEGEKSTLKALGDDILKAMEQDKKSALSITVAGETYVFKVTAASSRLKMSKARKERVVA